MASYFPVFPPTQFENESRFNQDRHEACKTQKVKKKKKKQEEQMIAFLSESKRAGPAFCSAFS